jgi:hypothetical protein
MVLQDGRATIGFGFFVASNRLEWLKLLSVIQLRK